MKKSLIIMSACALAFTACSVAEIEITEDVKNEGKLVTLTATVDEGDATKVAIVDHKYNWQAGDVIAVFQDDGTEAPITFEASSSAATSTFTATTDKTVGKYAIYPYNPSDAASFTWEEEAGDDNMIIKLPGSYSFQENALNIPMLGKISGSNITFKAIGGVLRFTVTNIPAEAATFSFTATNKQIAGEFLIEASADTPQINMEDAATGKEVSVDFEPGLATSLTFSIPVPVGTIDGFTLTVYDDSADEIYSVTSSANIAVARNQVIAAPTLNIPDSEEVVSVTSYNKVSSISEGDYLIVYESGTTAYVFSGVDAQDGYVSATIADGHIARSDALDLKLVSIASVTGGYSIKVKSGTNANKYLRGTSKSGNGLAFDSNAVANSITYENGVATINYMNGSDDYGDLQFNSASDNMRFRYFYKKGQKKVALYKRETSSIPKLNSPTGLKVNAITKVISWHPVYHADTYTLTIGETVINQSSTSYTFSGADDYYDVTVVAKKSDGSFLTSDAASLDDAKIGTPTLSTPTSFVTGTVTDNSIQVSWTGDARATKYHCTISPADAAAQEPTSTSVTFSGLTKGTDYIITVYAIDGSGKYENSSSAATSAIKAIEPAGIDPVEGVCFNLTSYGSIPSGWDYDDVATGSYFNFSEEGYMISPSYNIVGYVSATVSVKVAKYGQGTNPAAVLSVSYDGGETWAESKTLTAPTDKNYLDAQTLTLGETFTKTVVIKLENPSGNANLRVQNFSFTVVAPTE